MTRDIPSMIAQNLAESMFEMISKYPGHEKEIANMMASQLAAFVAISSKNPEIALPYYANYLAKFDWVATRRDHFAHTLGIKQTLGPEEPKVINFGDPNDRGKHEDS